MFRFRIQKSDHPAICYLDIEVLGWTTPHHYLALTTMINAKTTWLQNYHRKYQRNTDPVMTRDSTNFESCVSASLENLAF